MVMTSRRSLLILLRKQKQSLDKTQCELFVPCFLELYVICLLSSAREGPALCSLVEMTALVEAHAIQTMARTLFVSSPTSQPLVRKPLIVMVDFLTFYFLRSIRDHCRWNDQS